MNFQETKTCCMHIVVDLLNLLEDITHMLEDIDNENVSLKRVFTKCGMDLKHFQVLYENLRINLKMIERSHIKYVLLGKTSNGKSAVVNALLHDRVLPSSKGRTTTCFISVRGCDENEGYFFDRNDKELDMKSLKDFAHEFGTDKCEIKRVYCPKVRCPLLMNDVEIVDCPGSDYKKSNDDWIGTICEDADAFILVVDGNSTLNASEKELVARVKTEIAMPNIFVVVNKWDMIETEVRVDEIKKQHFDDIVSFLCEELNLYCRYTVAKRIHFISALKTLEDRDIGGTESFTKFEECLREEIAQNSVAMKFKSHITKANEITNEISDFVDKFLDQVTMNETIYEDLKYFILQLITSQFDIIYKESEFLIAKTTPILISKIEEAVNNKANFDNFMINFLERDFPKELSSIFSQNLQRIQVVVEEIYGTLSYCTLTSAEMKIYINGEDDFTAISKEYGESISMNIRDTSNLLRKLRNDKEKKKAFWTNVLIHVRSFTRTAGLAFKIAPVTIPVGAALSAALGAAGIAVELLPLPSTEDVKAELLKEFNSFYTAVTSYFIRESKKKVILQMERSIAKFLEHQEQWRESFSSIKNIKSNIIPNISGLIRTANLLS